MNENQPELLCLLNSTAEGIWTVDTEDRITYVNEAGVRLFGFQSAEQMLGKTAHELVHHHRPDGSAFPKEDCPLFKAAHGGKGLKLEDVILWKADGSSFVGSCTSTPLTRNGEHIGTINTFTDITDKVHLVEELQTARIVAEQAKQSKSSFLANMSHEIRTPLSAIMGFSELLKDGDLSENERDHFVETINRNGQALTRIIEDILDLAKVEARKLDVEQNDFSFYDLMAEAVELFRETARRKGLYLLLNIDDGVPNFIRTDPTRLRQILFNIIGNAIKFTTEGGVRVRVRSLDNAASENGKLNLKVEVIDTGCGMDEAERDKLFQPFTQGDNTNTRRFGGTGLGLALSRRLSEALGGNLFFEECARGKGCTVAIRIPASLPLTDKRRTSRASNSAVLHEPMLNELKILVVDDSQDNQVLARYVLEKKGANVDVASDGQEAVIKAMSTMYDLILLDIQMPQMDGYQAMRALTERCYDRPVVALTAHAMKEERQKTKSAGFAGHLTKPLNADELFRTIQDLTSRHH